MYVLTTYLHNFWLVLSFESLQIRPWLHITIGKYIGIELRVVVYRYLLIFRLLANFQEVKIECLHHTKTILVKAQLSQEIIHSKFQFYTYFSG